MEAGGCSVLKYFMLVICTHMCTTYGLETGNHETGIRHQRSISQDAVRPETRLIDFLLKNMQTDDYAGPADDASSAETKSVVAVSQSLVNPDGTLTAAGRIYISEPENQLEKVYCQPMRVTVPLPHATNPRTTFTPMCAAAMRCGGCCSSLALTCQPSNMTRRSMVVSALYHDPEAFKLIHSFHQFEVLDHNMCECLTYNTRCENARQRAPCINAGNTWLETQCACVCSVKQDCGSGFVYNENTCSCEKKSKAKSEPLKDSALTPCNGTASCGTGNPVTSYKAAARAQKAQLWYNLLKRYLQDNDTKKQNKII